MEKTVIALGGNALQSRNSAPTAEAQLEVVKQTCERIADISEAARYVEEERFAPGSMLPKVQACMSFVRSNPQKKAIITSLDKAIDALEGKTGTVFSFG